MLKNGLYNIVGGILRAGLTFLTIPALIRVIGIEEYGVWTLVSTVIGVVGLAEAGLTVSTTVFLSRDIAKNDTEGISQTLTVITVAMLSLASLAALILWMGSPHIIQLFPDLALHHSASALPAIELGAVVLWAKLMQQVMVGIEQAYQCYGLINLINLFQVSLTNLGMIAIALLGGRTLALMQWQVLTNIVLLSIHVLVAWSRVHKLKPQFRWSNSRGLEIVRYSAATWLTSLGTALFQQGDRVIIGSILDPKLLGVYAAITSVTIQINSFSAAAIQPLLPRLSGLLEGSRTQLELQIKRAFQVNVVFVLGLGGALFILTPILISILFGKAATDEYALAFRTATVVYSLYSVNAVGYYILLGSGAANVSMVINIISGALALLLIFIGAKLGNLTGAIAGNIGYATSLLFIFFGMKRLDIPVKKWFSWLHPAEILLLSISLLSKFKLYILSRFKV